ncbi:MAG TPA: VLRF1 family aeRF1-type release factor [Bryobacteraceae bacterium]
MAISKTELETLITRPAQNGGCVLSVYLNVDQSRSANLNRGYVRILKELLRACEQRLTDDKQRKAFAGCSERVLARVAGSDARARALALFCDHDGVFWERPLSVPLESALRWEEKPYVRPLVEAVDEYERYGVVLVGREKARLFTVYLGEIEEHTGIFAPEKRKFYKAASKDTNLSQPNLQRREEEHALWHLKEVAAALEQIALQSKFDRLVLAGPHEITTELHGLLSKKLQSLLVRSLAMPIDAGEQLLLKETMRIEEEMERTTELELVERLITAASKDSQAVLGLKPTLEAMRQGRILKLVYAQGAEPPGAQCAKCGTLFAETSGACAYCGGPLRPITDIVGRLADLVFNSGGQVENVRGTAAGRLREKEIVGAFLRF